MFWDWVRRGRGAVFGKSPADCRCAMSDPGLGPAACGPRPPRLAAKLAHIALPPPGGGQPAGTAGRRRQRPGAAAHSLTQSPTPRRGGAPRARARAEAAAQQAAGPPPWRALQFVHTRRSYTYAAAGGGAGCRRCIAWYGRGESARATAAVAHAARPVSTACTGDQGARAARGPLRNKEGVMRTQARPAQAPARAGKRTRGESAQHNPRTTHAHFAAKVWAATPAAATRRRRAPSASRWRARRPRRCAPRRARAT